MKRTLIRLFAILVLAVVAFLIYQDNKLTQDLMNKMDELTIVDPTMLSWNTVASGTSLSGDETMTGMDLSGDVVTGAVMNLSGATESSVDAPHSGTSAE